MSPFTSAFTWLAASACILSACNGKEEVAHNFELEPDRTIGVERSALTGVLELPDGRLLTAGFSSPVVTLLDSSTNAVATFDMRSTPDFGRVSDVDVADGGRVLILDGVRNVIHILRVDGTTFLSEGAIPTQLTGPTMRMCVAGNRIFVLGSHTDTLSVAMQEIDWNGEVVNSITVPAADSMVPARVMRLSQLLCSSARIAVAPSGGGVVRFFDLDGRPHGGVAVPQYGAIAQARSRDPMEPTQRPEGYYGWLRLHVAPDGSLVVQYAHYVGRRFEKLVTQTFSFERAAWSAPTRSVPSIISLGRRFAYGIDPASTRITRYRYRTHGAGW